MSNERSISGPFGTYLLGKNSKEELEAVLEAGQARVDHLEASQPPRDRPASKRPKPKTTRSTAARPPAAIR